MDKACFELKGSLFTLSILQLFESDLALLKEKLQERIKMAPAFFNHTPFVVDLQKLQEQQQQLDFNALKELLLSLSIIPVGVKGAKRSIHAKIEAAGMAVLAESKTPKKKKSSAQPVEQVQSSEKADASVAEAAPVATADKTPSSAPTQRRSKIIKQTIRSGQQIYAPGGDLVIMGSVSAGAEILADGNIHIYGTLRGRALAGVRGDHDAAIFCHCLQAELCSITGIYLLSDDLTDDKIGAAVHIHLEDETLKVDLLQA